jgi:aspartyl-tRNA(Asn)/glutamyl-tRNA(Gln) amidotransferase subunit A
MTESELPNLTAARLSDLMAARQVSPVEATEAYLRRIESIDPSLRAYLTVAADSALEQARQAERDFMSGVRRGPLQGVPVALKDQIWTADMPTTNGSTLLRDHVPPEDATVVSRLKAGGAVILGKLNMGEFAGAGMFRRSFPAALNPWNVNRVTGGSSSGSAVAAAARLCATALGEDTGGSIRSPASWCGVVGLRPTWGLVSRFGVFAGGWSMDTLGPMARTVEDCAITLSAIAGPDPRDAYSSTAEVPDYRSTLKRDARGLRVGVVKELTLEDFVAPEVQGAVLKAAEEMGSMGATLREVSIPLAAYGNLIMWGVLFVEATAIYRDWARECLLDEKDELPITYLIGSILPAEFYYKAQKLRELLRQQVMLALEEVDVLISPTVESVAPPVSREIPPVTKESVIENLVRAPFMVTPAHPLAGIPAISLPCGFASGEDGMPIGLQIGGRPFEDATVLGLAHAYEQRAGWHRREPDLAALGG